MDAAIRAVERELIQYTIMVYLDISTDREKENKTGKEVWLLLCFWHSPTALGQQR